MFETLSQRLQEAFRQISGRGKLSEQDVDAALREVRLALLEADVNFAVAKELLARVKQRAIGAEVARSLTPAQQIIKIVHQELIATLGEPAKLDLSGPAPNIIMLVGLQGSGKTTTAAKLAVALRRSGQRPLLVAADTYRPAAVRQLEVLGEQTDIPVHSEGVAVAPPEICRHAVERAKKSAYTAVILDTAGRLHVDEEMMAELQAIKAAVKPSEILLVADAMTGQDAVRVAADFDQQVGITGLILTKVDGDARGGAAISMRAVTGVPIKFLAVGEKLDALEPFYPDRLASRILGMGDMLTLVEKAEAAVDKEEARVLEKKLRSATFDLDDFLKQLRQVRKIGPIGQLMEMIPGFSQISRDVPEDVTEKQMKRVEAIISSMTHEERRHPEVINASRKRRIARGSGTSVQDVNLLLSQFRQMRRMMKGLASGKKSGLLDMFR